MYLMIGTRQVKSETIEIDEAKKIGLEFLDKIGIYDVKDTYYLKMENMAIINYAAYDDGVTMYPDLVKVKIALDTGEVLSVESQGYIYNHVKREKLIPGISINKAKELIDPDIEVISSGIAIIPTESKNEILVYEFKGRIDEREFIIYLNATTGVEEKILLIVNTPGGILTM